MLHQTIKEILILTNIINLDQVNIIINYQCSKFFDQSKIYYNLYLIISNELSLHVVFNLV